MQARRRENNQNEMLSGWKEIAGYLGRGVRTVQRYEHELGLPTKRISGHRSGSVLATKSDLDSWVNSRPIVQSSDTQQTAQVNLGSTLENSLRERSRLHSEMMTLREELKENIREIRHDILRLRKELQEMRERQDAMGKAVARYSKIVYGPTNAAKPRRPNQDRKKPNQVLPPGQVLSSE